MKHEAIKPKLPACPICHQDHLTFTPLDGHAMSIVCETEHCGFELSAGPNEIKPLFESVAMHYLLAKLQEGPTS